MTHMKKILLTIAIILPLAGVAQHDEKRTALPIIRTNEKALPIFEDGAVKPTGWWIINPKIRPDVYETSAKKLFFMNEKRDTLSFNIERGGVYDFIILQNGCDTAYTRIKWITDNPLEEPAEDFCRRSPSGMLSRKQAEFDIDALVYTFSEVHPNMFYECGQAEFMEAVNRVKNNLPDSLNRVQLYKEVAPLVAMLGDGHSNLGFPLNDLFTKELLRLPLFVDIDLHNYDITTKACIDSIIPRGSQILSINGVDSRTMLEHMMQYVSGERYFFRLARVNEGFTALFELLYAADSYKVEYRESESKKRKTVTLLPAKYEEISKRLPYQKQQKQKTEDYSFTIDKKQNVAIMDFRRFNNPGKMRAFADSMFTCMRHEGIGNLIIDIRKNGGGNSAVGDELFRYISPVPFKQMSKAFVRITPTTRRLAKIKDRHPGLYHYDNSQDLTLPLTPEEGRFTGNVYLLTSHQTFSSAGSFAWAFKAFGMGTIVGEETGGMNVCFGDILPYRLPVSGLVCSISYKRFWQYGADEKNVHGAIPHYAVPQAQAMDKALKLARRK